MHDVDCVIVGAGVIGLATARCLARRGLEVVVIEKEGSVGTGTSSRNSEVIHAGIYYPQNSLMAELCVSGRASLYQFCEEHGVPFRRCGKLIVATNSEELNSLQLIRENANRNGVTDLCLLTDRQAINIEPQLKCVAALSSNSTGIIDSHAYMLALRADAERHGVAFALQSPFLACTASSNGFFLQVGGAHPTEISSRLLINSAGLDAVSVAHNITGLSNAFIPSLYFAKGNYFSCKVKVPFSRLVYPVPVKGGLGIHLTIDLGGRARFGPDVEWIRDISYDVDPARSEKFYPAIRRYWPGLPDNSLAPAYAGIRPKLSPPNGGVQDFLIQGPKQHGINGLVNLFGIESPGLTSSLAIAELISSMLLREED